MKDGDSIINEIKEALGDGASRELADQHFEKLKAGGCIHYVEQLGWMIDEGMCLIGQGIKQMAGKNN